jgi:hypothetical protein
MQVHEFTSKQSLNEQDKDTKFKDQFNKVFKEFYRQPQTMKQVSIRTKIDRANICWYCRKLRKSDNIAPLKKILCPITKHRAILWTTNPDLFPKSNQLNLF